MSDTDFPADVHVLRPRKVSVSSKLDSFLDKAGLVPSCSGELNDNTRPIAGSINAIICADCSQVEYLTRDYCRCGHYLNGQLQDEFIVWERNIHSEHAELLGMLERTLKPLRLYYLLAIPFMLVPAVYAIFWSGSFTLSSLLWWMPVLLIAGAGAFAESLFSRPLKESTCLVENYTFDTFIEQRHVRHL